MEWINKPHRSDDDTPLADKGKVQAAELGARLKLEHIDHIFSSPFDRCINTAQIISSLRDTPLSIKVEPGICEVLYDFPPGYLPVTDLKMLYPLVDLDYKPALLPDKWEPTSADCVERVQIAAKRIRDSYSGSILFVSHGSCISAMLELWAGYPKKIGVCTICKLVPHEQGGYHPMLIGCDKHISDKTNLRAFW